MQTKSTPYVEARLFAFQTKASFFILKNRFKYFIVFLSVTKSREDLL